VTALVEDIYNRGLDRKVMLVVTGEFGRTPRVNSQTGTQTGVSQPGRDHWHHLLIDGGLSARQATLFIGSIAIIIAVVGLVMNHRDVSESIIFYIFVGFICVNAAGFSLSSKFVKFLVVKGRNIYFR
jgi:hypothetical protein